jgi:uncharacterized protein
VVFHLKELQLRKLRFDRSYDPGEVEFLDPKLRQVTVLETKGVAELLSNTLGEVRVRGELSVRLEVECDRCLEAAVYPIESRFDLFYRPANSGFLEEEVGIDQGEAEIAFYDGEEFDLRDLVREQVLLQLPMQRLCRPDCRGICPQCGANRNLIDCGCQPANPDDRWSALREWK